MIQRIIGAPMGCATRFVFDKAMLPKRREGQSLRARRSRQWGWLKEFVRTVKVSNLSDLVTPMP